MKIKIIILILLLSSSKTFACDCANVFNNSFLGNMESFDFIVKARIDKVDGYSPTLIVEETFKGAIKKDTIFLVDGFGCDLLLSFKPGDRIITGLKKFDSPDFPASYTAPGCITSAIYIKEQMVNAPELQLPMFKKSKIALFRSRMRLETFERKIRRRLKILNSQL